jgi:hypothetical protein
MDFTIEAYRKLLITLQLKGYLFKTFEKFIESNEVSRTVVLRHDVDRLPRNALRMARLENSLDVQSTYYFRIVPQSWNSQIIKQIVRLGHEVAYHYEDLALFKGVYEEAILHFEKQLARFRTLYPSRTICMHGSPMTPYDNRKIWERYDYRAYGITAEPYFDVDYTKVFYITDTGRCWNNTGANLRDTVQSGFDIKIKSTNHMITLFHAGKMPDQIIINTHPQRWFPPGYYWARELVVQNMKNIVKKILVQNGFSNPSRNYSFKDHSVKAG